MSDSDADEGRAIEILDRVASLVDEECLVRRFDEPIDEVVRTFEWPEIDRMSNRQFLDVLACFLQSLHTKAFPDGRQLTMAVARDEVVAMLNRSNSPTTEYELALLEVREHGGEGLATILSSIADSVKTRARYLYLRWVEATHIGFQDWHFRRRMAEILLRRFGHRIRPDVPVCPPAQMTEQVLNLLLASIASGDYRPDGPESSCTPE